MSNQFIQVPPDDVTGKRVETWDLTVNSLLVHREVDRIGGTIDVEIAEVRGTDPTSLDHGLVVRQAGPDVPKVDVVTSANLSKGASVDLDASTISSSTTGKLQKVTCGSTAPCQWEVKTRDGAVLVTKAIFYTGGLADSPSDDYTPTSKDYVTLAGNGVDENFRVTATNLFGGPDPFDADVSASFEWDEVA